MRQALNVIVQEPTANTYEKEKKNYEFQLGCGQHRGYVNYHRSCIPLCSSQMLSCRIQVMPKSGSYQYHLAQSQRFGIRRPGLVCYTWWSPLSLLSMRIVLFLGSPEWSHPILGLSVLCVL